MKKGTKYDEGKPRFDLLPFREVEQIVLVLTHGSRKYADNNWQHVVPRTRYLRAAIGHIWKRVLGEKLDIGEGGSGLPHLAHAICCLLFLLWADNEGKDWSAKK